MLGTLLAGLATSQIGSGLERLKKALLAYIAATALGLVGLIFLLISGTIWLSHRYGAIQATFGVGAGFLAVGVLILLVHKFSSSATVKVVKQRRNDDLKKAAIATGIAVLPTLLSGRAGRAALLAPAIGALAYGLYRENSSRTRRSSRHENNPS